MKPKNVILVVLGVAVVAALFLSQRESRKGDAPAAPSPAPVASTTPAAPAPPKVPPYHPSAEAARPLAKTLSPTLFAIPPVRRAYEVAGRIPQVLAQQPCYCWCDKFGHGSLLDCFASDHGVG
jgi:hypothetical protein